MYRSTAAVVGTIAGVTMLLGLKFLPPPAEAAHTGEHPGHTHGPAAVEPSGTSGHPPPSDSPSPTASPHDHDDGDHDHPGDDHDDTAADHGKGGDDHDDGDGHTHKKPAGSLRGAGGAALITRHSVTVTLRAE